MTPDPEVVQATSPIAQAARTMRDRDIGNVLVEKDGSLCGIVTDRDIVIRAVAEGVSFDRPVGDICSTDLAYLSPDDSVDDAVRTMTDKAVRRLPVCEGGRPVGVVSLGDLAVEREPDSALADISEAPPDR
jgi:signal-transduction protein with cAMP-binding, CBS, and nucleotidyltransferase domain